MKHCIWVGLTLGFAVSAAGERILPFRPELPKGIVQHILAMAGAFAATIGGEMLGLYRCGTEASFIGAVVGAAGAVVTYRLGWLIYLEVTRDDAPESASSVGKVPKKPVRDTRPRP